MTGFNQAELNSSHKVQIGSACQTGTSTSRKQNYVDFLREKERVVCPYGFLDSKKHRSSYELQQKLKQSQENGKKKRETLLSAVDISSKNDCQQRNFEKQKHDFEELSWKLKQEARELRQQKHLISRSQKKTNRSLRDLENDVAKKKAVEDKKLLEGIKQCSVLQLRHNAENEKMKKMKFLYQENEEKQFKNKDRNCQIAMTRLERRYRLKINELDLKRAEQKHIGMEYERKMKLHEDQASAIKGELVQLAIAINIEAQRKEKLKEEFSLERKQRDEKNLMEIQERDLELQHKISASAVIIRDAETSKEKFDQNLIARKSCLQAKQKENSQKRIEVEKSRYSNGVRLRAMNNETELAKANFPEKSSEITTQRSELHLELKKLQKRLQQDQIQLAKLNAEDEWSA